MRWRSSGVIDTTEGSATSTAVVLSDASVAVASVPTAPTVFAIVFHSVFVFHWFIPGAVYIILPTASNSSVMQPPSSATEAYHDFQCHINSSAPLSYNTRRSHLASSPMIHQRSLHRQNSFLLHLPPTPRPRSSTLTSQPAIPNCTRPAATYSFHSRIRVHHTVSSATHIHCKTGSSDESSRWRQ